MGNGKSEIGNRGLTTEIEHGENMAHAMYVQSRMLHTVMAPDGE